MTVLATIGYERCALDEVIAALRAARVSLILDIREAPVSRRPGFSKRALAAALAEAGIDYLHLRGLGTPKAGRDAARAGEIATFHRIFAEHMESAAAQADLDRAARYAHLGGACLLCYERDHRRCHRDVVAATLSEQGGFELRHLEVAL
ncbi:MAG: DUF488 domain-containing protein [Kiloniellales bacterium]|nr:DUF488 domain-containing protein [Kiloniellales bacterium]